MKREVAKHCNCLAPSLFPLCAFENGTQELSAFQFHGSGFYFFTVKDLPAVLSIWLRRYIIFLSTLKPANELLEGEDPTGSHAERLRLSPPSAGGICFYVNCAGY